MDAGAAHLIPNPTTALFALLASWVLFLVFAASALAFVLMIFGVLKPDATTRKYLFGVFSISVVGLFTSLATKSLTFDPEVAVQKINASSERTQAIADSGRSNRMTIFTQIGSAADLGTYAAIKKALPPDRYVVTAVDNVNFTINENQIRYCNPSNAKDAGDLSGVLKSKGVGSYRVVKISSCDADKNKNILEVWVKTSS